MRTAQLGNGRIQNCNSSENIPILQVDLKHMHQEPGNNVVTMGIDLTEFYLSVE